MFVYFDNKMELLKIWNIIWGKLGVYDGFLMGFLGSLIFLNFVLKYKLIIWLGF